MRSDDIDEMTGSGDLITDLQQIRAYYMDLCRRLQERPWSVNMTAEDATDCFIRDLDTILEDYEDENPCTHENSISRAYTRDPVCLDCGYLFDEDDLQQFKDE